MFNRMIIGAGILIALSGCSLTLPVRGQMETTSETFEGTATGYMDGSGNLNVQTKDGLTCTGNFVYVTNRNGEGVFNCEDGRSGPFTFVSTGSRGTGKGTLNGVTFTFTFGEFDQ